MKKTDFLYASAIMMACAFGVQSCSVESNPSGSIDPGKNVYVYDFEAVGASGNGTLYKNKNGKQNNGQAFPWWRNDGDTDRDRNEWKGYELKEAGYILPLPEVCHVWTSNNFRLGDNIKDNGLVIGSDCGIAIDGLKAGSKVVIDYIAPQKVDQVSLKDVPFGTWSAWVGGELTAPSDPDWNEGVSSGQPYGDGSVIRYADLSAYDKLVVTCTEGAPRFLLNRDVDEGQWSENEAESHLIDNTKGGWSAKYFVASALADGTTIYTVDLKQIVADKGFAHLHAIKGANWANCTLTSMKLEGAPYSLPMIWAVGDGSKNNNGKPLATALVDGSEAISGHTAVTPSTVIEVLSADSYKKSSGHIVVNAFKNTIIKKVTIDDAAE